MKRTTEELLNLNYYEILQVESHASQNEIRRAYYTQARLYHPDRIDLDLNENAVYIGAMALINNVYEVLSNREDPDSRSTYDTRQYNTRRHDHRRNDFFFNATRQDVTNAKKLEIKGYSSQSPETPEEFLCAITYEVMDNPVRLPSTLQICDRKTIERILRTKKENPFNRQSLSTIDLIPEPELSDRIDAFIESLPERSTLNRIN